MAKRFSDTKIWDEDWFLDMPNEYKLFWFYMLAQCDHAGLFKVNVRSFSGLLGVSVTPSKVIEYFNTGKDRVRIVNQSLWLIEDFFAFQYGQTFNPNNKMHDSIEMLYLKANIKITSIRGLKDLKDRVKDKDKDKKKGGVGENKKQQGVKFTETGDGVVFEDGTIQFLGQSQIVMKRAEQLSPRQVIKGNQY
jgi:hypothetical protein